MYIQIRQVNKVFLQIEIAALIMIFLFRKNCFLGENKVYQFIRIFTCTTLKVYLKKVVFPLFTVLFKVNTQ